MLNKRSEVVVRLSSGLGNQLFQLAQGMALAEKKNARLSFDTTWFGLVSGIHPIKRQLNLTQFRVPLPEAFAGPKRLAIGILAAFFDKTRRGKPALATLGNMQVIQENADCRQTDAEVAGIARGRAYLNGYWQSNGHFLQVRDKLMTVLELRHPPSTGAVALIAKATSASSGFIHVRRGDYVHYMGEAGTLPVAYYAAALSQMQILGKQITNWLIFSDDTEWAQANLPMVPNAEFVSYRSAHRDAEDLMIMKACSAGIIANSSYSWWGAALGEQPHRPIITPNRYWKHSDWPVATWALPSWTQVKAWD